MEFINQLLLTIFSGCFSNVADICWAYWRYAYDFLMSLESILTELQFFKFRYVTGGGGCTVGYGDSVNRLLVQFQIDISQTLLTYCGHIEDIHLGL